MLFEDFVVPAMYLRRQRVLEAWSAVRREVLAGQVGTIILYFLMKLVLAVGVGFIALVVTCLTCCLAALPYVGSVILLPLLVFRRSYSLCFLGQFGPGWRCFSEPIQPPLPPPFAAPPSAVCRRSLEIRLTLPGRKISVTPDGGCSSAWLEPQIVDLVVAGSNPVSHPILPLGVL